MLLIGQHCHSEIVSRDVTALPWNAGYAETINAGKSRHNEDQAMARYGRF